MMSSEPCQQFRHLLEAYGDGELEPSSTLAVEDHLESCETCRERVTFQRAMKKSLKRDVHQQGMSTDARARLIAALAAEIETPEESQDPVQIGPMVPVAAQPAAPPRRTLFGGTGRSWSMRSAVPLTAAAALALVWGASARGPLATSHALSASAAGIASPQSQALLEELVHEHAVPLPPERTKPEEVRQLEPFVGVPLKAMVKAPGARFVGGRVLPVHQERAAMLQYEVGSGPGAKRVSVLVYDPRRIQVGDAELSPRTVGTAEVRVGRARGYSVAVTQRDGVGYAITSDMDPENSAQFVNYVAE